MANCDEFRVRTSRTKYTLVQSVMGFIIEYEQRLKRQKNFAFSCSTLAHKLLAVAYGNPRTINLCQSDKLKRLVDAYISSGTSS